MPATLTTASAQRASHNRRSRLRRGVPGSATAEGTRSSGDCEDMSEESEVTAGLVSSKYQSPQSAAIIALKFNKPVLQTIASLCSGPKNLHLLHIKSKDLRFYLKTPAFAVRDL